MGKTNVWKRTYPGRFDTSDNQLWMQKQSFNRRFVDLHANNGFDIHTKRIVMKAAASVVCVVIFSGDEKIRWGSGFIIECDTSVTSKFQCTIITSASLLRTNATLNTLVDDLKIAVVLYNGDRVPGEVGAFDFHYNLAVIKIQVDQSLEIARLRHVDDFIPEFERIQLQPHSDLFRLVPGSTVIALGRYLDDDFMIAEGQFSIEQCRLDCKELLRSTCRITQCGIGGPLINHNAEVIGLNFFELEFTPFLPINIVSKWWMQFKEFGDCCRPWLGMEFSNLFSVEVRILEKIIQKFPNIKKGIIVEEVTPNSPAGSAGVHHHDIIVECDGRVVTSSLQFFDLTWDKVGKPVNLVVMRTDGSRLNLSMMVADISPNQFNHWPFPE